MELTATQVIVIGIVASVIAQGVKLVAAYFHKDVGRRLITIIIFVVALALAYAFARPALPDWPAPVEDPMAYAGLIITFIGVLVAKASALIGFAVVIYNLLLEKVFSALNLGTLKKINLIG